MTLKLALEAAKAWLEPHYNIVEEKHFYDFAIVLAKHKQNTPGTSEREDHLFVLVETVISLSKPFTERHQNFARKVGSFAVVVPMIFLHRGELHRSYISTVLPYGNREGV